MSYTQKTLYKAEVFFSAPRSDEPVLGTIVRVGLPAVEIKPNTALEDIAGRPIVSVIRAIWDVQVADLGREIRPHRVPK